MADSYAYEERPRRRGRGLLVGLLVLLIVLAGLLFAADRVAAGFAERAIAAQVKQEVAKQQVRSSDPKVSVGGFPFLTQVVAGKYQSISIVMNDVTGAVEGKGVTVPRLDINARNVKASLDTLRSGRGDVTAETVKGTGTVTYDSVAKLINRPGLQLAEQNGKLAVTAPVDVLGQRFTLHGTANLSVNKGQVALKFDNLAADGVPNIPFAQNAIRNYASQISINIPLPQLPFQLTVRDVRPLPDGLAVTADASNVPLHSVTG